MTSISSYPHPNDLKKWPFRIPFGVIKPSLNVRGVVKPIEVRSSNPTLLMWVLPDLS
jgi:hypothetical protein